MIFYDDRGHCPKCGRFCGQIFAYGNESRGLFKVKGFCKVHGEVDLTSQSWEWDDFFGPYDPFEIRRGILGAK